MKLPNEIAAEVGEALRHCTDRMRAFNSAYYDAIRVHCPGALYGYTFRPLLEGHPELPRVATCCVAPDQTIPPECVRWSKDQWDQYIASGELTVLRKAQAKAQQNRVQAKSDVVHLESLLAAAKRKTAEHEEEYAALEKRKKK